MPCCTRERGSTLMDGLTLRVMDVTTLYSIRQMIFTGFSYHRRKLSERVLCKGKLFTLCTMQWCYFSNILLFIYYQKSECQTQWWIQWLVELKQTKSQKLSGASFCYWIITSIGRGGGGGPSQRLIEYVILWYHRKNLCFSPSCSVLFIWSIESYVWDGGIKSIAQLPLPSYFCKLLLHTQAGYIHQGVKYCTRCPRITSLVF